MKVEFSTKVTGLEQKCNKEGNPYHIIGFLDGVNAVNLMVERGVQVPEIKPFDDVILTIDVNLGYYKNAKIVGIEK